MINFKRSDENPVLLPEPDNNWEGEAVFNGCPVIFKNKVMLLYRAESLTDNDDICRSTSSIGCARSRDGIHFGSRHQFIRPEHGWELYGCEDPRVTALDGKYYIFYTALSKFPFTAEGIKVGLAITTDFQRIEAKHPVTTFNSKAMALFPDRINGRMAVILTVNTDNPPAKIAIAYFEDETQIWSEQYWAQWFEKLDTHVISLARSADDHVEVGAPPLKTRYGWLMLYSYIKNYFSPPAVFGIEAALLDLDDPSKVLGSTKEPLLVAQEEYERYGRVPNIVFPSGAIIRGKELNLYYGAADNTCALATIGLDQLLENLRP